MANKKHLIMDIDEDVCTNLFRAVEERSVALVTRMLNTEDLDLDAVEPDINLTLLQVNAINGNTSITRLLVKAGCSIDATDYRGNTPLHFAIPNGQFRVANQLIELGADIYIKNYLAETPLQTAVTTLASNGMGKAKNANCFEIVQIFLYARANPNTTNIRGCAPIHQAAAMGHYDLVETLIHAGADIDLKCNIGRTALFFAIEGCKEEVIILLLMHGASVNIQTYNGVTPLSLAAKLNNDNRYKSIIKKLLEYGSDLNYVNIEGWTPFYDMVAKCEFDTLSLCIDKVNINRQTLAASSLLHNAIYNEDKRVIPLILDKMCTNILAIIAPNVCTCLRQ